MVYRPKYMNNDGIITDLPLESETAVRLKNSRTIGLSGVQCTPQQFNGVSSIRIPITSIPTNLLTGTIDSGIIPIAGVKVGGVKNGGNIIINSNGTMDYNGTNARNISVIPRAGLGNYTNLEDVLNYISSKLQN